MSESGGWCLFLLLCFGGPIGAIMATTQLWDDHRTLAMVALATFLTQLAGYVGEGLMVRDRLPGPEDIWHTLWVLSGVAGLTLGAYSLTV